MSADDDDYDNDEDNDNGGDDDVNGNSREHLFCLFVPGLAQIIALSFAFSNQCES